MTLFVAYNLIQRQRSRILKHSKRISKGNAVLYLVQVSRCAAVFSK